MGVLRQLGQLLWKTIITRTREPHILVLEIVWPILMFIIVALIRSAIPPENKPTCSYSAHAMPSAGLVPFLQSSVCNIGNKCEDRKVIEDRQTKASKLSALVSDVQPYLTQQSTLDALDAMETGVQLAEVIAGLSSNTSLTLVLGNDTMKTKSFFKNPNKVRKILVDDLKVMSPAVADAFLESTVNVLELLDVMTTGYLDFRGIVCDESKLKTYMFFPKSANITSISKELCSIPDSSISGITDLVLQQLDVAAIFRVAKSIPALTNDYQLMDGLEDIASLIDLLSGTSGLGAFFSSISAMENTRALLNNIPMYIDTLTKMGTLDTKSFGDLLTWVEPIVTRYTSDLTMWNQTIAMFQQVEQISQIVGSGEKTNWTALFNTGLSSISSLFSNSTDTTWLTQIMNIQSVPDLTNLTIGLLQGDMSVLTNQSTKSLMDSLQQMITSIIGEPTMQMILGIVDNSADMAKLTADYLKESSKQIDKVIKGNSAVLNAVETVLGYGPNVTMDVINRMLQVDNILALYNNTGSYVSVCHSVVQEVKDISAATRATIDNALCTEDIRVAIEQMVATFDTHMFQKQMETHLMNVNSLLNSTMVQTSMKLYEVYMKVANMTELFNWYDSSTLFNDIASQTTVDTSGAEWTKVSNKISDMMSSISWPVVVVTVGPVIEQTDMWKSMEFIMRSMSSSMETSIKLMEQMQDPSSSMTKMNDMLKMVMKYSPEITQSLFDMMKDPNMMNELLSSKDVADFCQKEVILKMPMPSYVPVDDINNMVCTTNWTQMIDDIVSTYDVLGPITKMLTTLSNTTTDLTPFDWAGMVTNMDKMMTLYSNPMVLTEGNPFTTLFTMNMSFIDETFKVVMYNLQQVDLQNITALTSSGLSMMKELDKAMSTDNMWRTIKVYLDVWNEYTILVNKQLVNSKFGLFETSYLLDMSPTFTEFIEKASITAPELLEALKNTTVDVTKFFEVLLKGDWNKICHGTKITDLLTSSSTNELAKFENELCNLNWTRILIELGQNQDLDVMKFTEKIEKLAMMDMNNVTSIDLDWDAVNQNTQKMIELLTNTDISKFYNMSWTELFTKFDLQKSNVTWNDFTSIFNMADGLDVQNLMRIFDGLNAVGNYLTNMNVNDTMAAMEANIIQSQLYQYHLILQFSIKQLQYFNETRHVDLRQYFKSSEVNKLLDVISSSPEVTTVALLTIIQTSQSPSKVNTLMTSWESMCTDLSVFKSVVSIPANTTVDPAALQTKICGVNLNYTKLFEEVMVGLDGLQELMESLTNLSGRATPSQLSKDYDMLNKLLTAFFTNPPNITISHSNDWLMESKYNKAWKDFLSKLDEGMKAENYMTSLSTISTQTVEAVFNSLAGTPEFRPILNYVSLYLTVVLDRLNQSQSVTDINSLFEGYPELEKAVVLMDNLPQLYQVWIFNGLYYSSKVSKLLNIQSWDQFCNMTDPLADVPGANFSVSDFKSKLCQLNLTKLMIEATEYQGMPELENLFQNTNSNETADKVDTAKLVAQYNQLSAYLLNYIEGVQNQNPVNVTLPRFLNMQYWLDTTNFLNTVITDPSRLMSLSSSLPSILQQTSETYNLQGLINSMMDGDPFFKQMMQTYKAAFLVFQHVFSKIENKTVIKIEDLFGNGTEAVKLWGLMLKPGVLETVLNSVNTPQMSSLFAKDNATEVIMLLCYTGNFSDYFTVPSYISLDIGQLKTDFCNLDLMKVASELMVEFDVYNSILTEAFNNSIEIEWKYIAGFLGIDQTLSNQITALATNPPMIELPSTWMNESYWLNLLVQYTQSRQDPTDTAAELATFMDMLKPMLNMEPFTSMGYIMDTYLQLLLDNMETVNATTLTLDNLFRSIPTLSKIYTTLQINDSALNELFLSPMKNPEEFLKLMSMTDPYKYFCEDQKHWHIIFVIGSDTPNKICSGNSSDILEKLLSDLKYTDYMSAVKNMTILPDWTRIIQNSMKLSGLITEVITSNNVKFDMSKIFMTLSSYNNTDFLWNYLSMFSEFGKIINGTSLSAWGELEKAFINTQMITQLTNMIMDKLLKPGNVLDFGGMVKNTSVVTALFDSVRINSESMNGLFSGYLRSDKITKFVSILGDNETLGSFLCDVQQWHEIFDFPSSLNLSEIISPLCRGNDTNAMMILGEQLDLEYILPLLMNALSQNQTFNIQTFTKDIEKLTTNLMNLFNVTSVRFTDVDFDKLGNINLTEVLMAIQTESAKLETSYPDMYSKLIQSFIESSTDSSNQSGGYILAAVNLWTSIFNKQLKEFLDNPMNLTTLLSGSNVGKAVDLLLKDPSWIDELVDVKFNPQKFSDMLVNDSSAICTEGFWDSVVTSGNLTAVHNILELICSLNETSVLQEAMSGFLNSHLFSQQFLALTDEYNKGNMAWNLSSLSPNMMELTNILMKMIQETTDFSNAFNVTSFSSVLQRLEVMMTQQLGTKLTEWSSVLLPFLSSTDPTLYKAIKTFNVIISEINNRLMYMQGTVSLSTLLKNSTELVDILDSIISFAKNGTQAADSNKIDFSKLSNVFSSAALFSGLCENKTLADYITPPGVMSPVAADLGKVMCIHPEAFLQILMNQTKSQQLQKQIEDIWNSDSTGSVDWQTVQQHINNFTTLLTGLVQQPPSVDTNLMDMLDLTSIMKSLEGMFKNPQSIFAVTGMLNSILNIPIDTSVYPYYLTWQEVYTQMNAIIKSLEGSPASTNGAVQNLWNAMSSLNSQLNLIQQNASYADLVTQLGKDTTLQSRVCDMSWVENTAGSDYAQKVYNALCGQDPKDWNKRLVEAGFPEYYGYFLLTNMVENNFSNTTMSELFTRFITQIQNLTTSLSSLSVPDLSKLQNILLGDLNNLTINPQFYQTFKWLNLMDNSTEGWLLGMLNFVTEINTYVGRQLSLLKGMNEGVPLTLLLPNNTVVAELLETTFGAQTAATILTFSLAPDKFLEIAFSNTWEEAVCKDVTTFAETFRIPVDSSTNITLLQQDLCEDLSKKDSTLNSLLQRLDMNDVFKAFDDWMMGKTSSMPRVNNTNLYMAIQQKIEEFVATVTRVQNLTLTEDGMDAWLTPIWKALESLNMPQDGMGDMCDAMQSYIETTPLYRDNVKPVLLGIYQNMENSLSQMKLQNTVGDLICGTPLNSTEFLQKILSSNLTALLQKILNPTMDTTGTVQCSEMIDLSNRLSAMINESFQKSFSDDQYEQCGENFYKSFTMFIQDTSSSFQLVQEVLKMLTDPSLRDLLGNTDLLPVVEFFLNAYSQQQSVTLKFMDIITKPDDFTSIMTETFQIAPEMIQILLQSTLKVDSTKLANKSSADLEKLVCNVTELDKLLTLPPFSNISISDISQMLCGNDTKEIVDIIKELLNIDLLSALGTTNATDLTWWTVTLGHLGEIIGHLSAFESLPTFDFSNLDINNLQTDLLIYMQKFVFDNGPEALARSLNYLIEDLAKIVPTVLTSPIVKDIRTVTLGLTSLKVIRNFIPANVLIRDVIKDRIAFKNYLTQQLNLSSSVADTLIESTIQYTTLLPYKDKDIHGLLCNATRLKTILSLPSSSNISTEDVVTSLCSLSEEKAINLTSALLMELDIGEMVEQYVSSGLDSLLEAFNKTREEMTDAVTKLSSAQYDFQKAAEAFRNSTQKLDLNIFLEPEYLTGSAGKQTLGDVLCGYNTSRIVSSGASEDISGASSKLTGLTKMVERQEIELSEMHASCKNVYDLIKSMDNGPVLWEYLKPLLWGKILYTPDTTVSRAIAEKVYNSSFKALAEVKQTVASWAAGTKSLVDMMKNDELKSKLESVLGNSLIDNMMTVMFGVSGSDFLDGFYSIETVNSTELDAIASISKLFNDYMSCIVTERFEAVDTEMNLEIRAADLNVKKQFLAGLVFENAGNGNRKKRDTTVTLPKHVSYKIRMDIDNVMHTWRIKEQFWLPKPEDNFFTELRYLRGFIQIQDILDRSIISLQTGIDIDNPAFLQEFPSTCYKRDVYLNTLSSYLLPVLMTVAWLLSVAIATRHLMNERENCQEEILKIMGMNSVLNWWVWFISTMVVMSVVSILCIVTLRLGNMYVFSDMGILVLYFLDFCFSSIMLCYMVSAFFTRTTLALLTVIIVYFLSYLPYVVLTSMETDMLFWQKTLACLPSTTAFAFAAQYLSRHEVLMEGIQWSNINTSPIVGDDMNFSWTCIMMLIDGCIYLVIGWYVRNVKPGKYGVSQPWYFPVSPYYWGCMSSTTRSANKYRKQQDGLNEAVDNHMVAGISINNLSKKYGKTKAVDNINAEFYENQVTILLGHNGAAKTTTLNMITGVLEPSSGSVQIYGKSPSKAKNIGICPQHSALFNYMTVQEHMKFYGSVKCNWPKHQLEENIYQLLKEVSLLHVRDSKVSELSGGMQRRLSVALAFVGGSQCVILDEPSSGVDPSARRAMWNLIMRRKSNCTVLLSTHFLDEADIIGDRIAIMHNGKIMCTGSSHFLKARLGSGYHLKIAKGAHCDQMSILGTITSLLPKADVIEDIGSEMTVSLSATVDNAHSLQKCLHQLDVNGDHLGIASYGLYDTTLEEVFMKVCDVSDRNIPLTDEVMHNLRKQTKIETVRSNLNEQEPPTDYDNEEETPYADPRKRIGTCSQSIQQVWALLLKRFHHYRRDWRMLIALVILPLLFLTAGLGFYKIKPSLTAPERVMTPALYGPDTYIFLQDNMKSALTKKMKNHLMTTPGPGTTCMAGMNLGNPFTCVDADTSFHLPTSVSGQTPQCSCVENKYTCNAAAETIEVPWIITNTTDILQDLDGHDISDYLLMTRKQFTEKRYGGLSFDADGSKFRSTVWFNNKGHHALPSFYNGLSNTMLRAMVQNNAHEYGITAKNHPIMLTEGQLSEDTLIQKAADYGIAMTLLVAFTFIPCGLTIYIVNEHRNKEKQLQFLSGVGPVMYWVTSLVWDMFLYCLVVGLSVAIMAIFKQDFYWDRDNLPAFVTLIILFGWATISQMYMTVKLYKDSTTSYFIMFCLNVFIGLVTMAAIFMLQFFSTTENVQSAYDALKHIFKIFPSFCLVSGFVELIFNQIMSDILDRFGEDVYIWPFDFDVIGWHLVALAIEGLLFFAITLLVEIRCNGGERSRRHEEELEYLDEAVTNERTRVTSGYTKDDLLVMNNLTKEYTRGRREFNAVDHVCLGVPRGECFGLLGENGAGKTTTFRMLTGDLLPTEGSASIKSQRITRGDASIGQEMGYCPQENALDSCLTGRELLHCHARLRGLPSDSRNYVVDNLIKRFNLQEADKAVHAYSGGMKRKLSVAMAMIGEPPIVMLDEPTTGMDPNTRRHVWNILLAAVKNQQSVVLSSHSMEECDALCTRLAIMVNGEFRCLGSPQHLKNLYGDGHIVTVYMTGLSTNKVRVKDFFLSTFSGCRTREENDGVIQVEIPKGKSSVADIFVHLERVKEEFNIVHYSVSQTTLDNVFLNFARDQNDGIVPEIYESSSEESHSTGGTWGERSSDVFTNPNYVYTNESFLTDKDAIPVRFNTNGRHSPIFATKM